MWFKWKFCGKINLCEKRKTVRSDFLFFEFSKKKEIFLEAALNLFFKGLAVYAVISSVVSTFFFSENLFF